MVVVQILCLALEPMALSVMFTEDMSTGKTYCAARERISGSLEGISLGVFFATFLLLLLMAYDTRDLPSLLSETKTIYNVAFTAVMVVGLGLVIILLTDAPTTSPNVKYVLSVAMVVSVALSMSFGIMIPKFKVILDGDDVRVNKLVSDHRASLSTKALTPGRSSRFFHSFRRRKSSGPLFNIADSTPLEENGTGLQRPSGEHAEDSMLPYDEKHNSMGHLPQEQNSSVTENSGSTEAHVQVDAECPSHRRGKHVDRRVQFLTDMKRKIRSERMSLPTRDDLPIFVEEDDSPPRRLLLRMVKTQELLTKVNCRIIEGCAITMNEWDEVKSSCQDLGDTFYEDVQFWWELNQEEEKHSSNGDRMLGDVDASQVPASALDQDVPDQGGRISVTTDVQHKMIPAPAASKKREVSFALE